MKSISQLLTDWRTARARMEKLSNDAPRIFGAESVKVVKDNFRIQGYDSGTGVKTWESRKASTNKAYAKRWGVKGSVYQASNPLLQQTRNLYNAVKYVVAGRQVDVGINLSLIPYAEKMNKGGNGTPARKFIPANGEPPNPKILKAAHKKIVSERDNAMKDFKK